MTLDNMTGITKGSYTGGDLFCKSQLITCNRVKECNGVCPFEDALKHADQTAEEQNKIDHDKEWIIGCIKHDGFIKTDRFDKANQIILDALEVQKCHINTEPSDLISREDLLKKAEKCNITKYSTNSVNIITTDVVTVENIKKAPSVSAERVGEWQYEKMVMPLSNHTKDSYRCSVCHTHWDCETNYCPNCGARMENKK